jgi:hypothetical protein
MAPPLPMVRRSLQLGLLLFLSACGPGFTLALPSSDAQKVCEGIDDCAQGGDYGWLTTCYANTQALSQQADGSGCTSVYNAYYACANANYTCTGATATFPGCDVQRASLESCLNAAPQQSACAAYQAELANCPADAGSSPGQNPIITACTLSAQCQARCYLTSVTNACSPSLADLSAYSACALSCPP